MQFLTEGILHPSRMLELADCPEVGLGKGRCPKRKGEGRKREGRREPGWQADVPWHLLCASAVLAIV